MKKWFRLFAALCLAAVLCVPLAACEWGSESGGSENGGNSGDPSAVRTTVTEEEWNAAVYGDAIYFFVYGQSAVFFNEPEANVTMVSTSTAALNGVEVKASGEAQIDGNKWYYIVSGKETFGAESEEWKAEGYAEILSFPEDGEGIIVTNAYSKDENGKWTVDRNESTLVRNEIDIVDEFVEMYDFENFTYNAPLRQYEAKDLVFDLGEESETSFAIDFMAFQFENGKLMHSETKISYEENGVVYSIHSVCQYENGRVVRLEQRVEQNAEDWSYSAVSSTTYSYGTASVTLPVVGE